MSEQPMIPASESNIEQRDLGNSETSLSAHTEGQTPQVLEQNQDAQQLIEQRRQAALAQMKEFQTKYPGVAELIGDENRGFFLVVKQPETAQRMVKNAEGQETIPANTNSHPMLTEAGWRVLTFLDYPESGGVGSYEQSEEHFQSILKTLQESPEARNIDTSFYSARGGRETFKLGHPSTVQVRGADITAEFGGEANGFVMVEKVDSEALQVMIDTAKERAGHYPEVAPDVDQAQQDIRQIGEIKI